MRLYIINQPLICKTGGMNPHASTRVPPFFSFCLLCFFPSLMKLPEITLRHKQAEGARKQLANTIPSTYAQKRGFSFDTLNTYAVCCHCLFGNLWSCQTQTGPSLQLYINSYHSGKHRAHLQATNDLASAFCYPWTMSVDEQRVWLVLAPHQSFPWDMYTLNPAADVEELI